MSCLSFCLSVLGWLLRPTSREADDDDIEAKDLAGGPGLADDAGLERACSGLSLTLTVGTLDWIVAFGTGRAAA